MRVCTARDFIAFLSDHRHDAAASEDDAKRAHELYRQHLRAARDQHGLSFLQPGRFLDPGSLGENSYMWFAPLDIPDGVQHGTDGTLAAAMERRFEAYKTEVVMPFYDQYFRSFSRQVVLVDVLGALLGGREVFEDTRHAVDAILNWYRHGSIIRRLLPARASKVLFTAASRSYSSARATISPPSCATVGAAARRSRQSFRRRGHPGDRWAPGQGRCRKPVEATPEQEFFIGSVPGRHLRPEARINRSSASVFAPQILTCRSTASPHHLDLALDYLVGDRLR
jgi:predicted YcjX-like family ATPase